MFTALVNLSDSQLMISVRVLMFLFHLLKDYKVSLKQKNGPYRHNNIPMALPRDGLPFIIEKL